MLCVIWRPKHCLKISYGLSHSVFYLIFWERKRPWQTVPKNSHKSGTNLVVISKKSYLDKCFLSLLLYGVEFVNILKKTSCFI